MSEEDDVFGAMKESIFDSTGLWAYQASARTGERHWGLYALSFKEAADGLVNHAPEIGQDFVVYPVMFLYRHCLELQIKHILLECQRYLGRGHELSDDLKSHDLNKNWNTLKGLLVELEEDWGLYDPPSASFPDVDGRIAEFHRLDQSSFGFRYPVDKKGQPSLKDYPSEGSRFDLAQVGTVVGDVYDWLSAVNDMLDHLHSAGP